MPRNPPCHPFFPAQWPVAIGEATPQHQHGGGHHDNGNLRVAHHVTRGGAFDYQEARGAGRDYVKESIRRGVVIRQEGLDMVALRQFLRHDLGKKAQV